LLRVIKTFFIPGTSYLLVAISTISSFISVFVSVATVVMFPAKQRRILDAKMAYTGTTFNR
jgi:hypothetical protein